MAGGFNAINILFRLTSEDNLTAGFNKAKAAIGGLVGETSQANNNLMKLTKSIDGLGMSASQVKKITNAFDGTDAAVNKFNNDMNKVIAKMREVGADDVQIARATRSMNAMRTEMTQGTTAATSMRSGISGIAIAAGAAFTMAGYYLENFVQECIQASMTIQQQNMEIGASMGMNAVDALKNGPEIQNMLSKVEAATGQNVQQMRAITPSVGLVAGGNMDLTERDLEAISAMTYARQGSGATLAGISGVYNKMVTSGATNPLSQMGISLQDMGMTRTEFQKLTPEERQNVINNAVLGKIGFMNADVSGTTGAQLQVFQGRLTQFMADIGDSFLPTMNIVMTVLEDLFNVAEHIPGLMPGLGALLLIIAGITITLGPLLIMAQIFDAEALANMVGLASSGILLFTETLVPYIIAIAASIDEIGLSATVTGLWAAAIDGLSLSAIYATAKEWLLAGSQFVVGDSGIAAAGGLALLNNSIRVLVGSIIAAAGLGGTVATAGASIYGIMTTFGALLVEIGAGSLAAGAAILLTVISGIIAAGYSLMNIVGIFQHGPGKGYSEGGYSTPKDWWNPMGEREGHAAPSGIFGDEPNKWTIHGEEMFKNWLSGFVNGMTNTAPIRAGLNNLYNSIKDTLSKLPGQAYNWGKNLIVGFAQGIMASAKTTLNSALAYVSSHFPHSQPKIGPLSTVKPENMASWMGGILSGAGSAMNNWIMRGYPSQEASAKSNRDWLSGMWNWGTKPLPADQRWKPSKHGAIQNFHISHGPVSIDASHMSPEQLMSMMVYLFEKYLLPGQSSLPTGPTGNTPTATPAGEQVAYNPLGGTTNVITPKI